jgi:hypothetical protein
MAEIILQKENEECFDPAILTIDGKDFEEDSDGMFEIPASILRRIKVIELPDGVAVQAVRKIAGTRDEYYRSPDSVTIVGHAQQPIAKISDAIVGPEDDGYTSEINTKYLKNKRTFLYRVLECAEKRGIVSGTEISEIHDNELFYYSYVLHILQRDWSVMEAIEFAAEMDELEFVIPENNQSLLLVLDLIHTCPFRSEAELAHIYLPLLSRVLGYQPGELNFEVSNQDYKLDAAVVSPSKEVYPWLIIEIKARSEGFKNKSAQHQAHTYLTSFHAQVWVIVSPDGLSIGMKEGVAYVAYFQSIEETDARTILNLISRSVLSSEPPIVREQKPTSGLFELDLQQLRIFIHKVEQSESNDEKGRSWEELAEFLLKGIQCLKIKYRRLRTQTSEIDMVAEYTGHPRSSLFDQFGRYIIIECRNRSKKSGVDELRDFQGKMEETSARLGIYVAREGITGRDSGQDGIGTIRKFYQKCHSVIVVLTFEDINLVTNGADLHAIIDEKVDRIVFDLA